MTLDTSPRVTQLLLLVREWQEARKPVTFDAPGVGVADTYQRAVARMAAADAALAACDLKGPAGGARDGLTEPSQSTGTPHDESRLLSEALDACLDDYNRMKHTVDLQRDQFARETLARSEAEARATQAEQRIYHLEKDRDAARGDRNRFQAERNAARADVERLTRELAEAQMTITGLSGACHQLERDKEYNASLVDERDRDISALQGELAEAQTQEAHVREELALAIARIEEEQAETRRVVMAKSRAEAERDAAREALGTAWDDGVRFAAEVLQSRVYPTAEARTACLERIVTALGQPAEPAPAEPQPSEKDPA